MSIGEALLLVLKVLISATALVIATSLNRTLETIQLQSVLLRRFTYWIARMLIHDGKRFHADSPETFSQDFELQLLRWEQRIDDEESTLPQ